MTTYNDTLRGLNAAYNHGMIDYDTYVKEVNNLKAEYGEI